MVRSSLLLDRPSHARGPRPAGEKGRQQHRQSELDGQSESRLLWSPVSLAFHAGGPGAAPTGPELDSLFDQVGCLTGPAMLGGLTRLVRRAGSSIDR